MLRKRVMKSGAYQKKFYSDVMFPAWILALQNAIEEKHTGVLVPEENMLG